MIEIIDRSKGLLFSSSHLDSSLRKTIEAMLQEVEKLDSESPLTFANN